MLIKSHEQLNQAVCETFFSSQLSKMGFCQVFYYFFYVILNNRNICIEYQIAI